MTARCEPCALRDRGESERAETIEAIRGQRLFLAMITGDEHAAFSASEEIGPCVDCLRRVITRFGTIAAGYLIHFQGSADKAAEAVAHGLAQDLNDLPPDSPTT